MANGLWKPRFEAIDRCAKMGTRPGGRSVKMWQRCKVNVLANGNIYRPAKSISLRKDMRISAYGYSVYIVEEEENGGAWEIGIEIDAL